LRLAGRLLFSVNAVSAMLADDAEEEENEFSSLRDQAQRLRRENSGLSRRLAEAEAQRNAAVAGLRRCRLTVARLRHRAAAAEASRREMVALSTLDKLRQLAAEVEAKSRRPSNALSACLRTWEEQLRLARRLRTEADSRLAADTSPSAASSTSSTAFLSTTPPTPPSPDSPPALPPSPDFDLLRLPAESPTQPAQSSLPTSRSPTVAVAVEPIDRRVWRRVVEVLPDASLASVAAALANMPAIERVRASETDLVSAAVAQLLVDVDKTAEDDAAGSTLPPPPPGLAFDAPLCAVCQEALPTTDGHRQRLRQLTCGHRFHEDCVRRWLAECSACPTCRRHYLMPEDFPPLV
ncbi:hypothetical protein BOX15_Mlig014668g1, partial [Macrostomum lignano]